MEEKLDLRIEKTYLALFHAFTELMEEKTFDAFTVQELCERAMIRRTTFYKHFADKYEYFSFYVKEVANMFRTRRPDKFSSDNISTYFAQMCRELLHFMAEHEKIVDHITESNMFPLLFNLLAENIASDLAQAMKEGKTLDKSESSMIDNAAAFYSGGMLNVLWCLKKQKAPIEEEPFVEMISALVK